MHHKRKKQSHFTSKTHGHGSRKKHRSSGQRGGVGKAGSGKRGSAKRMLISGGAKFGRHGFTSHAVKIKAINTETLQRNLSLYLSKKLITKTKDVYTIDLAKLGYDKIISKGKILNKLKISAKYATSNVVEKIKKAGGEVTNVSAGSTNIKSSGSPGAETKEASV